MTEQKSMEETLLPEDWEINTQNIGPLTDWLGMGVWESQGQEVAPSAFQTALESLIANKLEGGFGDAVAMIALRASYEARLYAPFSTEQFVLIPEEEEVLLLSLRVLAICRLLMDGKIEEVAAIEFLRKIANPLRTIN